MGKEIERKFLVDHRLWHTSEKAEGKFIYQGYLSVEPERTVRVRLAGNKGYITIKGKSIGPIRTEYEYEIPPDEAADILDELCFYKLSKNRFNVIFGDKIWEVDEFLGNNEGLIIAEIELTAIDEKFELPPWALDEVTHNPVYFNSNLAQRPSKQSF